MNSIIAYDRYTQSVDHRTHIIWWETIAQWLNEMPTDQHEPMLELVAPFIKIAEEV